MDPIPLPAPYAGVNEVFPVIAIEAPACENMLNFNVQREGVVLRNGDKKYSYITTIAHLAMGLFPYGNTRLFAVLANNAGTSIDIFDAETDTALYSSGAYLATTAITTMYFNKYQFFFSNTSTLAPGIAYDGAAFAAAGYTGTNLWPIGGTPYHHRAYLIQLNEAAYWYSGIDAISAACTKVDLSGLTKELCTLSSIGVFTLSDQVSAVDVVAFVFSNGEVLFYAGSYPDSADWSQLGTAKVGQPLYVQSILPYQGDCLLLCDTGVISLRDLFLKGSEQARTLSVNDKCQVTWGKLIQAIRLLLNRPTGPITGGLAVGNIRAIYDQKNDRIIISFPYFLNSSGVAQVGSFYFVFYAQLQSWFFHRSYGGRIYDIAFYKNKSLLLSPLTSTNLKFMIYEKEGATGFTDRSVADDAEVAFDFEIKSAPVANGRAFVQKAEGLDVILKSDLFGQTNYQFIKDFGVETTAVQLLSGVPTGSLQKPFVNMGIEGSYIQYKISGTTTTGKTVGLQIYGTNFWQNMGSSPR